MPLEVLDDLQAPSVRKKDVANRSGRLRRLVTVERTYPLKLVVVAGMGEILKLGQEFARLNSRRDIRVKLDDTWMVVSFAGPRKSQCSKTVLKGSRTTLNGEGESNLWR